MATSGDLVASSETLDEATRRFERQELALRTRHGVERSSFSDRDLELLGDHLARHPARPDRVVLTRRGRLMANEVAMRLR